MDNTNNFIGRKLIEIAETGSTNTFLQAWLAEENLQEGTAVLAEFQREGRGQRGTNWMSAPGENILLSILLFPHFLKPDEQFWLSKTVALGVKKFVQQLLPNEKVSIKWPNDIFVNDAKIAGILIENTLQANKIKSSIAGIGININAMDSLLPNATSLNQITGLPFEIKSLLPQLFGAVESFYLLLQDRNFNQIEAFYTDSLYGIGRELSFTETQTNNVLTGIIRGTTNYGALCIETQSGAYTFNLKEIKFNLP